ncbi:MAG: DUF3365 domain-containing protein [SAR324 cluster bacterium]|uniref:DUF3365 domain-containing protein n=1 Tax=SAR324 cluster bacterium TaxID=2024889 RepID=A0A7X9FQ93_9DELT|nr:DUF3365 domain-containing protein [SAR324 cluster bacterium]
MIKWLFQGFFSVRFSILLSVVNLLALSCNNPCFAQIGIPSNMASVPAELSSEFKTELKKYLDGKRLEREILSCPQIAQKTMKHVAEKRGLTISRASITGDFKELKNTKERAFVESFLKTLQSSKGVKLETYQIGKEDFVHYAPIYLDDALCLSCHGALGKDVNAATSATLSDKFDHFSLNGRKIGDLLGLWIIRPKR